MEGDEGFGAIGPETGIDSSESGNYEFLTEETFDIRDFEDADYDDNEQEEEDEGDPPLEDDDLFALADE